MRHASGRGVLYKHYTRDTHVRITRTVHYILRSVVCMYADTHPLTWGRVSVAPDVCGAGLHLLPPPIYLPQIYMLPHSHIPRAPCFAPLQKAAGALYQPRPHELRPKSRQHVAHLVGLVATSRMLTFAIQSSGSGLPCPVMA